MELKAIVSPQYPAAFRKWDASSWIRSKPLRDGAFDGLPFPPRLVPLASHPIIAGAAEHRSRLLAGRLLAHLCFTTALELEHVNPVCSMLARGGGPVPLSDEQRRDALRIYCDEGGHALFVDDLARKVEQAFGVARSALGRPRFARALANITARSSPDIPPALVRLLFAAVSETLVSRILREIPLDPDVAGVVRGVIGDHATDEAAHGAFFRWYFPRLWAALSAREREGAGRLLPELLWAFLGPDRDADLAVLRGLGFDPAKAAAMLGATYDAREVRAAVQQAARPTLQMFRAAGVFALPSVEDAFAARHLAPAQEAKEEG